MSEYRRAVEVLGRGIVALEGVPPHERFGLNGPAVVLMRSWLVASLVELGDFAEAAVQAETEERAAAEAGHPYGLAHACNAYLFLHPGRGRFAEAIAAAERGATIREELQNRSMRPALVLGAASGYAQLGRSDEAAPRLEAVLRGDCGTWSVESIILMRAVEVELLLDRIDLAFDLARRQVETSEATGERSGLAWGQWLLGKIAMRRDPPDLDEAEARYREALTPAQELEMRPLQARCHLGLGKLGRQRGRQDEARAALRTAVEMLRSMGMTFWLPEAEAALEAVGR